MTFDKINPWVAGIAMIFAGTVLYYFQSYRNNQFIDGMALLLVFFGWVTLFIRAVKNTPVHQKRIPFKKDKMQSTKQALITITAYAVLLGIGFEYFTCLSNLTDNRINGILQDRPTKVTNAVVIGIQQRRSRRTTRYYAVFRYMASNKEIEHARYEQNKGDFLDNEKFDIRYSVEYPEIFVILRRTQ
jgi:hypothetical protein